MVRLSVKYGLSEFLLSVGCRTDKNIIHYLMCFFKRFILFCVFDLEIQIKVWYQFLEKSVEKKVVVLFRYVIFFAVYSSTDFEV